MIAGLAYHRPANREELVATLASLGADAAVLGGGTMLMPRLGRREQAAAAIVDPGAVGLATVTPRADGGLVLGARVTYTTLLRSPLVAERAPLLATLAGGITGGAQIRNQGTVGGSACFANPASEVPACLVALGARLSLLGPEGERTLAAAEFFRGAFSTARRPTELLTEIEIPPASAEFGYFKLKLCESSAPIATAVASRENGSARIVLGAVAAAPLALDAAQWLDDDGRLEGKAFDSAVRELLSEPWEDLLADGGYRRQVAGPVARRAWARVTAGNGARR